MRAVFDNDVLLKGAVYFLLNYFPATLALKASEIGLLEVAKFVVTKRLAKLSLKGISKKVVAAFLDFYDMAQILEPTKSEIATAAELELKAQMKNLALDSGESLLIAIVSNRSLKYLATADKRAVRGIETLINSEPEIISLEQQIVSLEQIIHKLVVIEEDLDVRKAICGQPQADRALSVCFACSNPSGQERFASLEGLKSYINDLMKDCPMVMAKEI